MVVAFGALACTAWIACAGEDVTATTADSVENLCDQLCKKVVANCNTGDKQMFRTVEQCMTTCLTLEPGVVSTTSGNTIRCRIAEVDKGNCNGAGVLGGGVCGKPCDGFCRVEAATCADAGTRAYDTEGECIETCEAQLMFDPASAQGISQPFTGADTLNCRAQHLILAETEKDPHCGHLAVKSVPCSGPKPGDAGAP